VRGRVRVRRVCSYATHHAHTMPHAMPHATPHTTHSPRHMPSTDLAPRVHDEHDAVGELVAVVAHEDDRAFERNVLEADDVDRVEEDSLDRLQEGARRIVRDGHPFQDTQHEQRHKQRPEASLGFHTGVDAKAAERYAEASGLSGRSAALALPKCV